MESNYSINENNNAKESISDNSYESIKVPNPQSPKKYNNKLV